MDRSIPLLLIGLVIGGGIGFAVAAANGVTLDGHDHGDHGAVAASAGHGHDHEMPLAVSAEGAPPLALEVTQDPSSGWNLHVVTTNFAYAPERASTDHVEGEGHAHVYVDGVKLGRIYGPWTYLDGLGEGSHEVTVTLNANNHRPLAVEGETLTRTVTIGN